MSKKLTTTSPLKRPSTRSISSTKPSRHQEDKYTFQSDDDDHHTKPILIRKSTLSKRARGRPAKSLPTRSSISSTDSEPEEKPRTTKRHYEKPVTRRASRLGSQTNTPVSQIRDKIKINSTPPIVISPKKRGRKPKMLSTASASNPSSTPDDQQKIETENIIPSPASKRRVMKISTDDKPQQKIAAIDDKDLMQFGSPEHDDFSDDSVEFVWKGSSKMSIEILKRRIPKDEPRDHYSSSSIHSDPTAQRKRAIIPRLNNFDALSGKPIDNSTVDHDERSAKKSNSIVALNNTFQNDFDYSYTDKGTRITTNNEDKSRPRVYAVKSTTMKSRLQSTPLSTDIKRPKWMNDQQGGKPEDDEDTDRHLPITGEEPVDYDYMTKGQYLPKRPMYRGRGTYPGRRGTGMRGRPPGSRRHWNNDDDDDDYDQYEESNARYGPRKQLAYRTARPTYDMAGDEEDYEKSRRMSLTQAYRRNSDIRQPISNANVNRRMPLNNGNHPMYKDDNYYSHLSSRSTATNRLSTSAATTINTGNTFVAKINDAQLSEVANQSQIFFVNMPQQDQKNQQVLSVLASEQQQVLPVAIVQQAKVETPSSTSNLNSTSQNQTLAFTVKLPVDTPKQKKILPKPSSASNSTGSTGNNTSKPFAWSRPPGRVSLNNDDQSAGKGLTITPINTDLDTMEAAHVLATAADVTMAADARRKAQQHDDEMAMMADETPSNIANEETVQCEDDGQKPQSMGSITANIIDENGLEHTVILSTEEAQQLLGSQGAIIVDSDGQPISIQQAQTQTFLSPFALDQAQLQALLAQAGIDPNTPLTIEQIDPNQQQQVATLCTSPGGTQYTVLTQGPVQQQAQQQFILQTTSMHDSPPPAVHQQLIAPKDDLSSPPKRRAFAVKSTMPTSESFEDIHLTERPRRKIFATKSTIAPMEHDDEEGIIGTRAYHRK